MKLRYKNHKRHKQAPYLPKISWEEACKDWPKDKDGNAITIFGIITLRRKRCKKSSASGLNL